MRTGSRRQRTHSGEARKKLASKHARKRLGERYGIYVSQAGIDEISKGIQAGEMGKLIYKQSNRKSWHLVEISGWKCIAVFDAHRQMINTFLGIDALATIGLKLEDVA